MSGAALLAVMLASIVRCWQRKLVVAGDAGSILAQSISSIVP
jgi:hypothetical protein